MLFCTKNFQISQQINREMGQNYQLFLSITKYGKHSLRYTGKKHFLSVSTYMPFYPQKTT